MSGSSIYWLECVPSILGTKRRVLLYDQVEVFSLEEDDSIKALYYKGAIRYEFILLDFKGEEDFDFLLSQRNHPV